MCAYMRVTLTITPYLSIHPAASDCWARHIYAGLLGSNVSYLQLQSGTPTPKPPVHDIPRSGSTTPR